METLRFSRANACTPRGVEATRQRFVDSLPFRMTRVIDTQVDAEVTVATAAP